MNSYTNIISSLKSHRAIRTLLAASLLTFPALAPAKETADVHAISYPIPTVVIDGKITEQTYEDFLVAALRVGQNGRVFISSPGGDLFAAMKIGRLVRELRWEVKVPWNIQGEPRCEGSFGPFSHPDFDRDALTSCTCLSACTFVFVGGFERSGQYLGVHRPRVDPSLFRDLELSDAESTSIGIHAVVQQYLDDMGAPQTLFDEMMDTPPDRINVLDRTFVQSHIGRFSRHVEDWVTSICGRQPSTDVNDLVMCHNRLKGFEQERAFLEVMEPAVRDHLEGGSENEFLRKTVSNISSLMGLHWLIGADASELKRIGPALGLGEMEGFRTQEPGYCRQTRGGSLEICKASTDDAAGKGTVERIVIRLSEPDYFFDGPRVYGGWIQYGLTWETSIEHFAQRFPEPSHHAELDTLARTVWEGSLGYEVYWDPRDDSINRIEIYSVE